MAKALGPGLIEHIHDSLVGIFLPFDEKVTSSEYRNRELIASAAGRPFQTVFGDDAYPTVPEKAAALFHSLACNHCFLNGNKRTAVIALDFFLAINNYLLAMTSDEIYELAKSTVQANGEGQSLESIMANLSSRIAASTVDASILQEEGIKERLGLHYDKIHEHMERFTKFIYQLAESLGLEPPSSK